MSLSLSQSAHSPAPIEPCDVVFPIMPYHRLTTPALGASILQSCLQNSNISAQLLYLGFDFASAIGLSLYQDILNSPTTMLYGEWTFSHSAFPDYFSISRSDYPSSWSTDFAGKLSAILPIIDPWIDKACQSILLRKPKIVICSSLFQQNVASLAVMRRLKALEPSIKTILGGPNAEGILGVALLRRAPWLDYVSSGDGELVIPELCASILQGASADSLPVGVISQTTLSSLEPLDDRASVTRATLENVNQSPPPNFDDYFASLQNSHFSIKPWFLYESSRGCWWGQRSQCTFCGLNGEGISYRSKTVDPLIHELDSLSSRFSITQFQFVDNILDKSYLKTLLPSLNGKGYELFYETKTDLSEDDFVVLKDAGVTYIQPGIESLSSHVLRLMKKGTRLSVNLRCLRLCREFGILPFWNILHDFPDEKLEWYEDMNQMMPWLSHLPPASCFTPIRFDRFSPHHDFPKQWGLTLEPYSSYSFVYPAHQGRYSDIAYFFRKVGFSDHEASPFTNQNIDAYRLCHQSTVLWRQAWTHKSSQDKLPVLLLQTDSDGNSSILDSRPVQGPSRVTQVSKNLVSLLKFCRDISSSQRLVSHINSADACFDASDLSFALEQRWIIQDETTYVSLVLDHLTPFNFRNPPGGSVIRSERTEVELT